MHKFHHLKVCFAGIGSIATKHVKNLREVCSEYGIEVVIDALRRQQSILQGNALKLDHVYTSESQLPENYDIIFITNPTDLHIETLQKLHGKGKHFFIEKPVTSIRRADEVLSFPSRKDSVYYVACPMRYKKTIQYIRENIDPKEVIGVRCICSSYLPEWRPGTDYRKCYSSVKALGGGVATDLIHEWDYLTYLFDFPKKVYFASSKKSTLEIDCEDYSAYIAEYSDKMLELHLDYYGREPLREIMLFTKQDTIVADLQQSQIKYLKEERVIDLNEETNFNKKKELEHFLDILDGYIPNDNDMVRAYRVLLLTQGIISNGKEF